MSKLTIISKVAKAIEEDLRNRIKDYENSLIFTNDFDVYIFEQTWGSTALGFPGFGGQSITSAYTFVLVPYSPELPCFVYFGGRFAYAVPYGEEFVKDIVRQNMASVRESGKYLKK